MSRWEIKLEDVGKWINFTPPSPDAPKATEPDPQPVSKEPRVGVYVIGWSHRRLPDGRLILEVADAPGWRVLYDDEQIQVGDRMVIQHPVFPTSQVCQPGSVALEHTPGELRKMSREGDRCADFFRAIEGGGNP